MKELIAIGVFLFVISGISAQPQTSFENTEVTFDIAVHSNALSKTYSTDNPYIMTATNKDIVALVTCNNRSLWSRKDFLLITLTNRQGTAASQRSRIYMNRKDCQKIGNAMTLGKTKLRLYTGDKGKNFLGFTKTYMSSRIESLPSNTSTFPQGNSSDTDIRALNMTLQSGVTSRALSQRMHGQRLYVLMGEPSDAFVAIATCNNRRVKVLGQNFMILQFVDREGNEFVKKGRLPMSAESCHRLAQSIVQGRATMDVARAFHDQENFGFATSYVPLRHEIHPSDKVSIPSETELAQRTHK